MAKRILDICLSFLALALLAVPMMLIALAIRLGSRGRAIFRQERIGRGGKLFTMLKFRTMRADVDPYGSSPHSSADARLTRIGRLLRETSIDELPQLLNVLVGQMSLVGPRPLYERQAAQWNDRQRRRLEVRPGITGYAQAFGRGGLTIEEKLELDVFYVDNMSLWLDLKIMARTLANIFVRRAAVYEHRYSQGADYEGQQPPGPAQRPGEQDAKSGQNGKRNQP